MEIRAICAVMLISAVVVAGCGSGDKPQKTTRTSPAMAAKSSAEKVIRGWTDTLRRGDVNGAARYFALPAVISDSGLPLKLVKRSEVVAFNKALPCGAKVVSTKAIDHGYMLTTFLLTERPGAGTCGSGTGDTARVAIRVRDGKITDWLRASDLPKVPQQTA